MLSKKLSRTPTVKTDKAPDKTKKATKGKNPAKFLVMNGYMGRGGKC